MSVSMESALLGLAALGGIWFGTMASLSLSL